MRYRAHLVAWVILAAALAVLLLVGCVPTRGDVRVGVLWDEMASHEHERSGGMAGNGPKELAPEVDHGGPFKVFANDHVTLKDSTQSGYTGRVAKLWVTDDGTSTILWFGDSRTSPVELSSFPTTTTLATSLTVYVKHSDFETTEPLLVKHSDAATSKGEWWFWTHTGFSVGDGSTTVANATSVRFSGASVSTDGTSKSVVTVTAGGGGGSSNMWILSATTGLSTTAVTTEWAFRDSGIVFTTATEGAETGQNYSHIDTTSPGLVLEMDRSQKVGVNDTKKIWITSGDRTSVPAWEFRFDQSDGMLEYRTYDDIGYAFLGGDNTGTTVGRDLESPGNLVALQGDGDVVARLNSADGSDYLRVQDSSHADVATINSDGDLVARSYTGKWLDVYNNVWADDVISTAVMVGDQASSGSALLTVDDSGTSDGVLIDGSVTYTGKVSSSWFQLTDGATIAVDFDDGAFQYVTLGGNRAITFADSGTAGRLSLMLIQDSTGGRTISSWPSGTTWAGGPGNEPTLTTTPGGIDIITFMRYDHGTSGTVFMAWPSLDFWN